MTNDLRDHSSVNAGRGVPRSDAGRNNTAPRSASGRFERGSSASSPDLPVTLPVAPATALATAAVPKQLSVPAPAPDSALTPSRAPAVAPAPTPVAGPSITLISGPGRVWRARGRPRGSVSTGRGHGASGGGGSRRNVSRQGRPSTARPNDFADEEEDHEQEMEEEDDENEGNVEAFPNASGVHREFLETLRTLRHSKTFIAQPWFVTIPSSGQPLDIGPRTYHGVCHKFIKGQLGLSFTKRSCQYEYPLPGGNKGDRVRPAAARMFFCYGAKANVDRFNDIGQNGEKQSMLATHLCFDSFCLNPNHITLEDYNMSASRTTCPGPLLPFPACMHEPPCLIPGPAFQYHGFGPFQKINVQPPASSAENFAAAVEAARAAAQQAAGTTAANLQQVAAVDDTALPVTAATAVANTYPAALASRFLSRGATPVAVPTTATLPAAHLPAAAVPVSVVTVPAAPLPAAAVPVSVSTVPAMQESATTVPAASFPAVTVPVAPKSAAPLPAAPTLTAPATVPSKAATPLPALQTSLVASASPLTATKSLSTNKGILYNGDNYFGDHSSLQNFISSSYSSHTATAAVTSTTTTTASYVVSSTMVGNEASSPVVVRFPFFVVPSVEGPPPAMSVSSLQILPFEMPPPTVEVNLPVGLDLPVPVVVPPQESVSLPLTDDDDDDDGIDYFYEE